MAFSQSYLNKKRISKALRNFVRDKINPGTNIIRHYVGLSRHDFREYLELQFLPGMTWDNYCKVWEIDHLAPCNLFDMTNSQELEVCWNFLNLMPMFEDDNLLKGNSLEFAYEELMNRKRVLRYNKILDKLIEKVKPGLGRLEKYHREDLEFLDTFARIHLRKW